MGAALLRSIALTRTSPQHPLSEGGHYAWESRFCTIRHPGSIFLKKPMRRIQAGQVMLCIRMTKGKFSLFPAIDILLKSPRKRL